MSFSRGSARARIRRTAEGVFRFAHSIGNYLLPEMDYVPGGWYAIEGWNADNMAEAQERHWPDLVRNLQGTGPLGVSHLPWNNSREDHACHNTMMSYGYVLARAARHKDKLSILDWGGGIGHYYLYSKVLLPDLDIAYDCFELPPMCRVGRKLQPEVRMHEDQLDFVGKRYDLVLNGSSLHYVENWRDELGKLAAVTGEFLYVSRLQSVSAAPSFVALHKVFREGYAEFLSWCINRSEFVACAEACGLELLREFVFAEQLTVRGAPEKAQGRGFLFRRPSPSGEN